MLGQGDGDQRDKSPGESWSFTDRNPEWACPDIRLLRPRAVSHRDRRVSANRSLESSATYPALDTGTHIEAFQRRPADCLFDGARRVAAWHQT